MSKPRTLTLLCAVADAVDNVRDERTKSAKKPKTSLKRSAKIEPTRNSAEAVRHGPRWPFPVRARA
jgi:hypothetical protein